MNEPRLSATERYFLHLLACSMQERKPCSPYAGAKFSALLSLALRQSMEATVCDALLALDRIPADKKTALERTRLFAIRRDAQLTAATERIQAALEQNRLRCMPLKGAVLKHAYPKPYQRAMTDLDFLIDEAATPRLDGLMKEIGFRFADAHQNHRNYQNDSGVLVEFHTALFSSRGIIAASLGDPWADAVPCAGTQFCFVQSPTAAYLYLILHLYEHYAGNGVGARFVLDSAVLRRAQGDALDWVRIRTVLSQAGLLQFAEAIDALGDAWCADAPLDSMQQLLSAHLLEGGLYGSASHRASREIMQEGGRAQRILHALFEPKAVLMGAYPVLQKAPFLLPFCYLHRIPYRLITRRKEAKARIAAGRISDDYLAEQHQINDALGLQN